MAMMGLRASYHRILDRIEHVLPSKLRPIYNHPAGSGHSWLCRHDTSSRETQYLPVCCVDSHGYISHSNQFLKKYLNNSNIPVSLTLCYSGLIWSRYSLVIIPKNWNLFAVNFFVGGAGGSQLYRIWKYNREQKAKEKEAQA
uniref:Mitochondrial pyruvate carrier n=2 Tax=Cyprinus carpio TaxID=7962 RepID=A0A8C2GWH3_CYPCA